MKESQSPILSMKVHSMKMLRRYRAAFHLPLLCVPPVHPVHNPIYGGGSYENTKETWNSIPSPTITGDRPTTSTQVSNPIYVASPCEKMMETYV